MERPIFQPVGTPVKELDTPALLLDLDVATSNIQILHQFFEDTSAKVRPHVGCHQCPRLARLQMAAGGTVGGIAVTTVGEAEVFSDAGFNDILVTREVVTRPAIRRLCGLAQFMRITVAVDHPQNVADLSQKTSAYPGACRHICRIHQWNSATTAISGKTTPTCSGSHL